MRLISKYDISIFVSILGLIFSILGIAVSLILSLEYLTLLSNQTKALSCDINAQISCSSVMLSNQAKVFFNIPNTYFGFIFYSVMLTFFLINIFEQINNKILNLAFFLISLIGITFSAWLMHQSIFAIGSLCPYCIVSFISSSCIFFAASYLIIKNLKTSLPLVLGIKDFLFDKKWIFFFIFAWFFVWILIIFIKYRILFNPLKLM